MDRVFPYSQLMGKRRDIDADVSGSARALAENLRTLMDANPALNSNPKLGEKTGLGASAISRLVGGANTTMATVDTLAKVFHVEPWQLLVPGLDPKNLPVLQPLTEQERALYQRLKEALSLIQGAGPQSGPQY